MGHCLQVCVLDIISFLSNKALKPFLHVVYESCIYPFCVCMRVTLDAFNICIEPLWIIMYRAVTPMAKLYGSFRVRSQDREMRLVTHSPTPRCRYFFAWCNGKMERNSFRLIAMV